MSQSTTQARSSKPPGRPVRGHSLSTVSSAPSSSAPSHSKSTPSDSDVQQPLFMELRQILPKSATATRQSGTTLLGGNASSDDDKYTSHSSAYDDLSLQLTQQKQLNASLSSQLSQSREFHVIAIDKLTKDTQKLLKESKIEYKTATTNLQQKHSEELSKLHFLLLWFFCQE